MIVLMWLTHAPLKIAAMLLAWLLAPLAARASMLTDSGNLPRRLGWKDSGNRDRLIHVMHINPFRTWKR